ncbi:MAG: thrombospondin type 3 repeat-containing protein [Pseudomonadota bacterium]
MQRRTTIGFCLAMLLTLSAQAAELSYSGEVTDVTGAFVALTPVGTEVGGPIEVDDAALAAGSIGIADITSINVNVGGFCFATGGGDCGGVGAPVPITSIDSAAITGTSGILGGSFSVTAFSPTFMVSIPIEFDLDNGSFSADGDALGTVAGIGMLEAAAPPADTDADGVGDLTDNCTLVPNPDQIDTNGDGIGNRCDADVNNDCIINFIDISMFTPRFNTATGDPGYDPDYDIDSSGSLNFVDYIAYTSNFQMTPGPSATPCGVPSQ